MPACQFLSNVLIKEDLGCHFPPYCSISLWTVEPNLVGSCKATRLSLTCLPLGSEGQCICVSQVGGLGTRMLCLRWARDACPGAVPSLTGCRLWLTGTIKTRSATRQGPGDVPLQPTWKGIIRLRGEGSWDSLQGFTQGQRGDGHSWRCFPQSNLQAP